MLEQIDALPRPERHAPVLRPAPTIASTSAPPGYARACRRALRHYACRATRSSGAMRANQVSRSRRAALGGILLDQQRRGRVAAEKGQQASLDILLVEPGGDARSDLDAGPVGEPSRRWWRSTGEAPERLSGAIFAIPANHMVKVIRGAATALCRARQSIREQDSRPPRHDTADCARRTKSARGFHRRFEIVEIAQKNGRCRSGRLT